jgi:formate/nitrite transporter FocA (FNT family)
LRLTELARGHDVLRTMRPDSGVERANEDRDRLNPVSEVPDLSPKEQRAVAEQSRPNAALIHETIRAEGETELERSSWALILSGFAAGLSMGFSLIVEGLLQSHLPDAPWRELVTKLGYTAGFLIVVLGRQQLFTENTLTPILPLLHNRTATTLLRVMRLWALVLAANIAATWAISAVLAYSDVFDPAVKSAFADISVHSVEGAFGTTLLKGAFAGWLIALMVWLLPSAGSMRPIVIMLITYIVGIAGLAHVVAGSVDAAYLVHAGRAGIGDYLGSFFVPTFIGNTAGGIALVAVLNYGQVAPELRA